MEHHFLDFFGKQNNLMRYTQIFCNFHWGIELPVYFPPEPSEIFNCMIRIFELSNFPEPLPGDFRAIFSVSKVREFLVE